MNRTKDMDKFVFHPIKEIYPPVIHIAL